MDQNNFLRDFIKMRQELRAREGAYMPQSTKKNAPSSSLHTISKPTGMTFATLVEEKPPKADVIKYLRHKLDTVLDEMSD